MLTYGKYLKIDALLSLQELESAKHGRPAHDELLFITIHQVYELWFKEILFELDTLRGVFSSPVIPERMMHQCVAGLHRVVEIMKILVSQVMILETMTPSSFMEFRDFLAPSSGFQSVQFRLLENKLGIRREQRVKYHNADYLSALSPAEREAVERSEKEPSLLTLVEQWLERTPGLESDGFDFWKHYTASVHEYLADGERHALACTDESQKAMFLSENEKLKVSFASILDEATHVEYIARGDRRLSHAAMRGAILIFLYRDEPRFSLPFSMLQHLMEIDSQIMKWRHNHLTMVQRMIGSKVGTGGSSGYHYLRSTVSDRYKVFIDLFNMTTFLIPSHFAPALDENLLKRLRNGDES